MYANPSPQEMKTMKRNAGRRRNYAARRLRWSMHALAGLSERALLTHGPGVMPGLGTELANSAKCKQLEPKIKELCQLAPIKFRAPLKRYFFGAPSGKPQVCEKPELKDAVADYVDKHGHEEEASSEHEEEISWENAGEELRDLFAKQRHPSSREYVTDAEKDLIIAYAKANLVRRARVRVCAVSFACWCVCVSAR